MRFLLQYLRPWLRFPKTVVSPIPWKITPEPKGLQLALPRPTATAARQLLAQARIKAERARIIELRRRTENEKPQLGLSCGTPASRGRPEAGGFPACRGRNRAGITLIKQAFGFACQNCDSILPTETGGRRIYACHILPYHKTFDNRPENVMVLCASCHDRLDVGTIATQLDVFHKVQDRYSGLVSYNIRDSWILSDIRSTNR